MNINEEYKRKLTKGLPKRLTIDGKTEEHESFLIPIDYLFYNNLNGRIATYIEEYNDQNANSAEKLECIFSKDIGKYNDLISGFIKKSSNDNESSFRKTKGDIKAKGQQNPGVILTDGRIIDGNRRFTAIRELYNETGEARFAYFEAVILPAPDNDDKDGWKRIKTLELFLQFNVDEKKDYNRIDFLVSFYRDTVDSETRMFDKKQYCYASGLSAGDYEKNVNIIRIMLDYLEWRNKPKSFYILKNEKLDGPIEDIAVATRKMNDEEWDSIKDYIYQYITHVQSGDRTRDVRELVKSAKTNSKLFANYKDKIDNPQTMTSLAQATTVKDSKSYSAEETASKKKTEEEAAKTLVKAFEEAKYEATIETANNEPISLLGEAIKKINKIDLAIVENMNDENKNAINDKLAEMEAALLGIKNVIGK